MIATEQMELSLKSKAARPQKPKKAHDRSQWWFRRMHSIVDQADAWAEGSVRSSAQACLSLKPQPKRH